MRILFTFENPLPSAEADAEVFTTTAKYLAPLTSGSYLHIPMRDGPTRRRAGSESADIPPGITPVRALAPIGPAVLRHVCCGLTLPLRKAFRQADLVYTRNLWIAWIALLFGQRVVFDHYRPWPDQIPPLQFWLYRLFCHPRLLVNICHSDYTRAKYLSLGIPADKLQRVHNGYEPERLREPLSPADAKQKLGLPPDRKTIVYTGRVNRKKGLELLVEAARRLPDVQFVLVGSYGAGPIEALAKDVPNIAFIPFQPPERLADYLYAADVLLIPPSWQPLAKFGSTVLPLKLFLYMAAGRPIIAGETPDVTEMLRHGANAFLCRPDSVDALSAAIACVLADDALAARLAAAALDESREFTWSARARKISSIIADRLPVARTEYRAWSRAQFRAWLRQSGRWLVHLVRERSFVLPPSTVSPGPLVAAEQD
jgi:glycosyltransferase involved in cell wall biosynthesis